MIRNFFRSLFNNLKLIIFKVGIYVSEYANSLFYKDSLNHLQELGRDNDPKIRNELSKFKITLRKIGWEILSLPGLRFMCDLIYPSSTISHFDREGAVAFTIDDGFCGVDNPNGCMVEEIIELFKKYDSNATFFVNGSHCLYTDKLLVSKLHENGHEVVVTEVTNNLPKPGQAKITSVMIEPPIKNDT